MNTTPYNAPTYFSPAYFDASTVDALTPTSGQTIYNAPTYFAPSYFSGGSTVVPIKPVSGQTPYFTPTYFAPSYFSSGSTVVPTNPASGQTPYFSPTYFAPAYFSSGSTVVVSNPTSVPTPYLSPTYFSWSYFSDPTTALAPSTTPTPVQPSNVNVVEPQGRDQAAYAALLGLLRGTGAFEEVIFGNPARRGQAGAGTYPLAVVTPRGWDEVDDYDPTLIVRRVLFAIRIVVRSDDEDPPFEQLDQLGSEVQGVVDGSSLGGTCVPAMTRIRSGRYEYTGQYPEQCIDLEGEFSSLFDPSATQT